MISKITVIGAGTMGRSISHVYARHGYEVTLYDADPEAASRAEGLIRRDLEFLRREDYITQDDLDRTMSLIKITGGGADPDAELADAVYGADYVLEAIPEDLEAKKAIFEKLDGMTKRSCVLATNTSTLRLSEITERVSDERKKLCMVSHWVNPAYLVPMVELSNYSGMPDEVFQEIWELHEQCEKRPIELKKEAVGMVSNRILHAITRECMHIIDEGIADPKSVDDALTYGMCFRFATTGIREVIDLGGMDVWYKANSYSYPYLCADTEVSPQIRDRALRGDLGIKSGKGFFDYSDGSADKVVDDFYRRLLIQLKASEKW